MKHGKTVSVSELEALMHGARNGTRAFVTNFFVPREQWSGRLQHGLRVLKKTDQLVVLIRAEHKCSRLFFAGARAALPVALTGLRGTASHPLVIDLIGRAAQVQDLAQEFCHAGFRSYLRLIRMSRSGVFHFADQDGRLPLCVPAKSSEARSILKLLRQHFDVYTDRLPSREEIREAIDGGELRVAKNGRRLEGFLWQERTGVTSTVRYWCSDDQARGRGVGGRLMRDYFQNNHECARHLLWVRENNATAINCYQHYGYSPDGLQDHVLIRDR